MNARRLLFKTFVTASSSMNILKNESDPKKRKKVISTYIARGILYGMTVFFTAVIALGYVGSKLGDMIPASAALIMSIMLFVFTMFKANAYFFDFKQYDQIVSMPFKIRDIISAKFFHLYFSNSDYYFCCMITAGVVYFLFVNQSLYAILVWIILSIFLPIIPMGIATLLGSFIANLGSHTKFKQIVQAVFSVLFTLVCFSLRFIIDEMMRDKKYVDAMQQFSARIQTIGRIYPPIVWFSKALNDTYFLGVILLIVVSVIFIEAVAYIMSVNYTKIHSRLETSSHNKRFKMKRQKSKNIVYTISFKEYKRMLSSNAYLVQMGMGVVFAVVIMGVSMIFGFDKIIAVVTNNAPFNSKVVIPAIPYLIYFFTGMVSTTAVSHSLEGKNYWIIQTLPIKKREYFYGKMLFNIMLFLPVAIVATVVVGFSASVSVSLNFLFVILICFLTFMQTLFGMILNIKFPKMDFENDIDVVKRGASIGIYIFPNMILSMGLAALNVFLGLSMRADVVILMNIVLIAVLTLIFYVIFLHMTKDQNLK